MPVVLLNRGGEVVPSCCYSPGMKLVAALIFAFMLTVGAPDPALAHRPYFTQIEKILLPNGEIGEVKLLNTDGILGPDPVRVLILDSQGRLLARSHESDSMALSCRAGGHCLIFDFSNGKILSLDPASFQQGSRVPDLADGSLAGLGAPESWGFSVRDPDLKERLLGYRLYFFINLPFVAINIVAGFLFISFAMGTIAVVSARRRSSFQTVLSALLVFVVAGMELFLLLMSGFVSFKSGLTLGVWIASFGLGGGLFLAGAAARRRIRADFMSGEGSAP